MIDLRDYQLEAVDSVRLMMRKHRNILLQSPTGSGKTAIASHILKTVADKGKTGFFICHRRELVDQTAKTFDKAGIDYGYIASGYPNNFYKRIQICSIDTLKNRLGRTPVPDLCIWDEAHHVGAAGWSRVHGYFNESFHLGLSATPQRLDGKGLDDNFDTLVLGKPVSWLIENGYLSEYKLFSVPGVDLSGVHSRMGDYVKTETEHAMDKPTITGDIIKHWQAHASVRKTIGFAVSVAHSKHICEQFCAAGISAMHLDATTPKDERRNVLRDFARGRYQVIFNVALFAEGFDIAANSGLDVTVGCVIDAAPTQSLGAWLQRCGRALRPQDEPAVILDHAGNWGRHGSPCQEREWTLEGRASNGRGKSDDEPAVQSRQCTNCYAVHKPAPECPYCGHVYPIEGRKIEQIDGDLHQIDPNQERIEQKRQQGRAQSVQDLVALGYSEGRARHILEARQKKASMQTEAFNLEQAARHAGIHVERTDIRKLKPKALSERIEYLRGVIYERA